MTAKSTTPCNHEGCSKSLANHKWARIKADDWFQQKDGTIWCPDHIPEWVTAWRAGPSDPTIDPWEGKI